MIVKTAWPALIPAIKRAGHEAVLVTEAELLAQHGKRAIHIEPEPCPHRFDYCPTPKSRPCSTCKAQP